MDKAKQILEINSSTGGELKSRDLNFKLKVANFSKRSGYYNSAIEKMESLENELK